jgi:hypothetical protein
MERRLPSWKKIYLSQGGHQTLIKSTLSSLPTYFFDHFPLQADLSIRLEHFQRDFLWDGIPGERKFHFI